MNLSPAARTRTRGPRVRMVSLKSKTQSLMRSSIRVPRPKTRNVARGMSFAVLDSDPKNTLST